MRACDPGMPAPIGVPGWLRAVAIAAAVGIEVSRHLYPESSARLMQITETARWPEWQNWVNPLLSEPFAVAAGRLDIPDKSGAPSTGTKRRSSVSSRCPTALTRLESCRCDLPDGVED
jgi:hypothetical protein